MDKQLWHGQPCPVCGVGHLQAGVRDQVQHYKGQTFQSQLRGAFCDHCAEGILEYDEQEEAAWQAFRDQADAQAAAELARIRRKLKLTQAQAAKLTGGGKNAFSRYERGQAQPLPAVIHLFRLLDLHPELLTELRIS